MKQIRVTLTDEQYDFAKAQGKLWLRDVVQRIMDARSTDNPGFLLTIPPHKPWWKLWH